MILRLRRRSVAAIAAILAAVAGTAADAQMIYSPRQVVQTTALIDTPTEAFAAPGSTDAVSFLLGPIGVQIGGSAASYSAVLERSSTDPGVGANWAQVASFSGAAAAGGFSTYAEPGLGWWRIRVTAVSGGGVFVAMTGRRG